MIDHGCQGLQRLTNTFGKLDKESLQPRTVLGRKLVSIRAKIVASGESLLNWAEIEREVAERRGEAE